MHKSKSVNLPGQWMNDDFLAEQNFFQIYYLYKKKKIKVKHLYLYPKYV